MKATPDSEDLAPRRAGSQGARGCTRGIVESVGGAVAVQGDGPKRPTHPPRAGARTDRAARAADLHPHRVGGG